MHEEKPDAVEGAKEMPEQQDGAKAALTAVQLVYAVIALIVMIVALFWHFEQRMESFEYFKNTSQRQQDSLRTDYEEHLKAEAALQRGNDEKLQILTRKLDRIDFGVTLLLRKNGMSSQGGE